MSPRRGRRAGGERARGLFSRSAGTASCVTDSSGCWSVRRPVVVVLSCCSSDPRGGRPERAGRPGGRVRARRSPGRRPPPPPAGTRQASWPGRRWGAGLAQQGLLPAASWSPSPAGGQFWQQGGGLRCSTSWAPRETAGPFCCPSALLCRCEAPGCPVSLTNLSLIRQASRADPSVGGPSPSDPRAPGLGPEP